MKQQLILNREKEEYAKNGFKIIHAIKYFKSVNSIFSPKYNTRQK